MSTETASDIISDEEATEMISKLARWANHRIDDLYPNIDRNAVALIEVYRATRDAKLNLNLKTDGSQ